MNIKELKQPGTRLTSQRKLIFNIIKKSDGHLDADGIYREARRNNDRISLSTVYRALNKFKEMGLVDEVHFGEEHHHYETRHLREHHHLVCRRCGTVMEFEFPLIKKVRKEVPQAKGFEILEAEVNLTGYCPQCRRREWKTSK